MSSLLFRNPVFVHLSNYIIDTQYKNDPQHHIELNGYMENVAELTKPPFDKPISFIKLFDAKTRTALMETINQVRENAVQITAS